MWFQICFFHPYLGRWSNLMSIFFRWVETTTRKSPPYLPCMVVWYIDLHFVVFNGKIYVEYDKCKCRYIYIYHTWMVRERLFRVPGCFFCDESFLSREAANNLSHGRIKSARFRTDLLVGSKHSFERTNPTGASAVKKASLFSRSISSLQNDDMKVTLCFALPVLTFQQKHQESCIFWTHRRFAAVFVFLNTYMNVWWYCWKKSG